MKKRDLFFPILKNTVPPAQVAPFSKNILQAEADVRLQPGRHHDGVPVAGTAGIEAKERPRTRGRSSDAHVVRPRSTVVPSTGRSSATTSTSSSRALRRTLEVSAIAIAGAFVIGLVLGAARAHRVPVVSQLAAIYVEIIRNTPILVQIFFLFFGLPQIGIVLEPFTVAWLAVTIWGGAFNTENFRAGFEAVPFRFREAGFALGFGRLATFLNVTLPIGGRIALPSSINTYISVVKNTSLMYVISYPELTTTALKINALTLQTVETFTTLAVTYLVIVWTMSALDPGRRVAISRCRRTRDESSPTGPSPSCATCSRRGCVDTLQIAAISLVGKPARSASRSARCSRSSSCRRGR